MPSVQRDAKQSILHILNINTAIRRDQRQRKRNTVIENGEIPFLSLFWNCNSSSLDEKSQMDNLRFTVFWYKVSRKQFTDEKKKK